ncbi:carboxylesterase 5A-like [Mytilus edulis]|uniref:carboxylesterase 5A-like n=1 Tax=Mytilus edulis TaxID=6550 RepID=UPI0039EF2B15
MGKEIPFNGAKIYRFYGVPYAEQPARFKKPQKIANKRNSTLNAMNPGKLCIQSISDILKQQLQNSELTEDCLYVDIYVPRSLSEHNKKAVVIMIPGDFRTVQTSVYTIFKYLGLYSDAIFVYVSFRVDIFGFLSTGDNIIPGNFGLWDQQMAIEWVNENIHAFGGDSSRITLTGLKIGAIFVGLQVANSLNKDKIHRIVVHSGYPDSKEAIVTDAEEFAQRLAKHSCQATSGDANFTSQQIYDCLVTKPATELLDAVNSIYPTSKSLKFAVGPVIDNDFILETANFNAILPVDVLSLCVSAEGMIKFKTFVSEIENEYNINVNEGVPKAVLCNKIVTHIVSLFFENRQDLKDLICNFYTKNDSLEQSRDAVRLIGDILYYSPIINMLNIHDLTNTENSRFLGLFSVVNPLDDPAQSLWNMVPSPGTTTMYLSLKDVIIDYGFSFRAEETNLGDTFMKYWSNFVGHGNPNPCPADESLNIWPLYDIRNQYYMHFSSNFSIHQEHSLYKDRMQFWMETVPDFLGIPRTNLTSTSGRMPVTSTHCPQQISTVTDMTIKKITRETSETITETSTESINNHINILKSDLRILLIVPFILIVICV